MADIFEIVGKISLDGVDKAEKELKGLTDEGEKSSSKLSTQGSYWGWPGGHPLPASPIFQTSRRKSIQHGSRCRYRLFSQRGMVR